MNRTRRVAPRRNRHIRKRARCPGPDAHRTRGVSSSPVRRVTARRQRGAASVGIPGGPTRLQRLQLRHERAGGRLGRRQPPGGPKAFSPLMPAFGEALSIEEIELAVSHSRSFCDDERGREGN